MLEIKLSVCTVADSVGGALVNEASVATGAPLEVNSVKLAELRRLCVLTGMHFHYISFGGTVDSTGHVK